MGGLTKDQLTSERLQKLLNSSWTLDNAFLLTVLAEDLPVHIANITPLYFPKENLVGPKLLMELATDEDNPQRKRLVNRMKPDDFSKMVKTRAGRQVLNIFSETSLFDPRPILFKHMNQKEFEILAGKNRSLELSSDGWDSGLRLLHSFAKCRSTKDQLVKMVNRSRNLSLLRKSKKGKLILKVLGL